MSEEEIKRHIDFIIMYHVKTWIHTDKTTGEQTIRVKNNATDFIYRFIKSNAPDFKVDV